MIRALFVTFIVATAGYAQITQRNLLGGHFSLQDIKSSLIARTNWKPYPKVAAEWKERVPQSLLDQIVKKGEAVLSKELPAVPATLLLEYVRDGNRSHYEAKSFERRN